MVTSMRSSFPRRLFRLAFAIMVCCMVGCGSRVKTVRAWGEVRWRDKPVEEGVIVFFPIDGTAGPSTGGGIKEGRYDVSQAKGPRAGGTYRVEITAVGPERRYSPSPGSPETVPVRDQQLPPRFNTASTLRAVIAPDPDSHQQAFLLN